MPRILNALLRRHREERSVRFSSPLVLLQSDDWGRVGIRDQPGFEQLRGAGLRLGEHPYDLYSLETAEDVSALAAMLSRHRDSNGSPACMVMNFCTANLDFEQMRSQQFARVALRPLADGLPGNWCRAGLMDAYIRGVKQGVFYPALHGRTHFCLDAVEKALSQGKTRARLLRLLWDAETPYIYWRMPWVGYEFWEPEARWNKFVSSFQQQLIIQSACREFAAIFGFRPFSACAPGYRANTATHRAWASAGIRVAQNGSGHGLKAPHFDGAGILHLYRNVDFEPSQKEVDIGKYVEIAASCFARGIPLIISTHAINFHSTLKDFRSVTLNGLDALLTRLEIEFPDLIYANDQELHDLTTRGELKHERSPSSSRNERHSTSLQEVM